MTEPLPPPDFRPDIQAAGLVLRQAIANAEGPLPPPWFMEFLLKYWRRFLVYVHHDHGDDSDDWKHAVDVTRRLLLSIVPANSTEQRSQVLHGLPRLITDVKLALDASGVPSDDRGAFLDKLRDLHMTLFDPNQPLPVNPVDLSDTITMDVRDPRYRALLDKLDGADSVEYIEM
ncbi:MAG: DUF1631 family protein [Gammaproteobacteria bacterium]|nr:DUF1631 family protein [Gammaproteobacteria bacterium]MBI5614705.1 DUF1631 family protein [Gammaproteobacteria bacterium]